MDSVRESIFLAIQNVLKGVSGIGDVKRGELDALEILVYPAASVMPGADNVVEYLNTRIDRQLTIYTFLWIKTQGNIAVEIEAFLPKVQQAMVADHTLGGWVIDITEVSVHEPFPLSEETTDAGVILEHAVIYRVNRQDPYSQV